MLLSAKLYLQASGGVRQNQRVEVQRPLPLLAVSHPTTEQGGVARVVRVTPERCRAGLAFGKARGGRDELEHLLVYWHAAQRGDARLDVVDRVRREVDVSTHAQNVQSLNSQSVWCRLERILVFLRIRKALVRSQLLMSVVNISKIL